MMAAMQRMLSIMRACTAGRYGTFAVVQLSKVALPRMTRTFAFHAAGPVTDDFL
jgi:hypothetical protein